MRYCCDWVNDELPYRFNNGLINLPLNHELSDRQIITVQQQSADSYAQQARDAFDWLSGEGASGLGSRILPLHLTPYIMGLPYRISALEALLCDLASRPQAWTATAWKSSMRGGAAMNVRNPRTGEYDYQIMPLSAGQLAGLASAMRAAQPAWAARGVAGRGEVLLRLAAAINQHRDAISDALTVDTGRAKISQIEVEGTVRLIERWAQSAPNIISSAVVQNRQTAIPGISTSTRIVPYPLVGVISPWNFPLTLALIDAIPALMAGVPLL